MICSNHKSNHDKWNPNQSTNFQIKCSCSQIKSSAVIQLRLKSNHDKWNPNQIITFQIEFSCSQIKSSDVIQLWSKSNHAKWNPNQITTFQIKSSSQINHQIWFHYDLNEIMMWISPSLSEMIGCSGVHFTWVHEETVWWTSYSYLPCKSVTGFVHLHQDIGQHPFCFCVCWTRNLGYRSAIAKE